MRLPGLGPQEGAQESSEALQAEGDVGLMIPWYVWPCPLYDELISSTADIPPGRKSAVVVGGSAGPGPERPFSQLHAEHWGRMVDAGWALYGYVYCSRGDRPLSEVLSDIDGWVELYGKAITGIFVDEVPCEFTPALLDYCLSITARTRARGLRVALNPGTRMVGIGAAAVEASADVVVAFEAAHETWDHPWGAYNVHCGCSSGGAAAAAAGARKGAGRRLKLELGLGPSDLAPANSTERNNVAAVGASRGGSGPVAAAIIHSFKRPEDGAQDGHVLTAVVQEAAKRGYGLVFVTDAGMNEAYSRLPSFWSDHAACLASSSGGGADGANSGGGGDAESRPLRQRQDGPLAVA